MQLRRELILQKLRSWEQSPIRSPLILTGPRQCGKTTILRQFGDRIAQRVFEINFWQDSNNQLKNIFINNSNAEKILQDLADYFDVAKINLEQDLLFIDEIQDCVEAYSSLKIFKEKFPQLKILTTGSYLQLFLKNNEISHLPVGCVDEFRLSPLTFSEFLENYDPVLFEKFSSINIANPEVSEILHQKLLAKLYEYFFTGGMPEIVNLYLTLEKNNISRQAVRKKQEDLLIQYVLDFQKYGKSSQIKKIDLLFQNIPIQLDRAGNEEVVSRFQYGDFGKNAKYQTLHWPFQFLQQSGLIIKSYIISDIHSPFRVHEQLEERNLFKCFYFDMGLLGAALKANIQMPFEQLGSYKGYLAENFVATALQNKLGNSLYTYKKSSKTDSSEIEFIISDENGGPVPIEVKSSAKSLKSKSLDFFCKQFSPTRNYKLVPKQPSYNEKKGILSLPIYLADKIPTF